MTKPKIALNQLFNAQKANWWALGIIVFMASQTFVVIDPGIRGIRVTLGQVDTGFLHEGLNFRLPFIQRVVRVPIKQQTVAGDATCFSSDLQSINVHFKTLYRIPEDKVVELFQKYQGDPYESLIEPRIQESMKEVAAGYRAEDLVKARDEFKALTLERVQKDLSGLLAVTDIAISNIDLSDELEQAIEQKQIKEQEALAKRYELDKARKDAEITVVNAEAEATAVKIKGEALRQAPSVIELEIARKWDGKAPSTVVVGKGGGNVLLPLR